jgi:translation elongation factor EF-Tu-like GTPase
MITVLAKISFYTPNKGRRTPIVNGYRPLFNFGDAPTKISGRIDLIAREELKPGTTDFVKITFVGNIIADKYFKKGSKFTFDEGLNELGEGEVYEF